MAKKVAAKKGHKWTEASKAKLRASLKKNVAAKKSKGLNYHNRPLEAKAVSSQPRKAPKIRMASKIVWAERSPADQIQPIRTERKQPDNDRFKYAGNTQ